MSQGALYYVPRSRKYTPIEIASMQQRWYVLIIKVDMLASFWFSFNLNVEFGNNSSHLINRWVFSIHFHYWARRISFVTSYWYVTILSYRGLYLRCIHYNSLYSICRDLTVIYFYRYGMIRLPLISPTKCSMRAWKTLLVHDLYSCHCVCLE